MITFFLFTSFILFLYTILILSFLFGWLKIKSFEPEGSSQLLKISVVIPFRNEERNLKRLLETLMDQNYPADYFEIVAVNDHSTDSTLETIAELTNKIRVLNLPENFTGKKQALDFGIKQAKYDSILVTDADCIVNRNWIRTFSSFYYFKHEPKMIIGLVDYSGNSDLFSKIQNLEFLSLLGSGAGAAGLKKPIFCNGANLFFSRNAYLHLKDPLKANVISGDDTFLLHNIKNSFPDEIYLLKSKQAIVKTSANETISGFFQQRIRWASKAKYYKDFDSVFSSSAVFLINLLLLVWFFAGLNKNFTFFFLFLGVKTGIDLLFLYFILGYFDKRKLLFWVPFVQIIYPVYIVFTAIFSFYGTFFWKNRIIR